MGLKASLDCVGKPDGNYPDPVDPCSGYFYMCSNGIASYFVSNQPHSGPIAIILIINVVFIH